MRFIKKWFRDFFGFTGKEINGFMVLFLLVVIFKLTQYLYIHYTLDQSSVPESNAKKLDSLVAIWNATSDSVVTKHETQLITYFQFDPNKISEADFKRLGFNPKLAQRIINYREKGGVFFTKSDLLKIYGMDSTLYKKLNTYITLPDKKETKEPFAKTPVVKKENVAVKFDINLADSMQLKSVYGIGSKLAARIIKYRNALGGFVNDNQLKEVYGLDSITINKLNEKAFIDKNFEPVKLNINKLSEKELASHPYLKKFIAKAIVAYRFQHGNFTNVEDIRKIFVLKTEDADKLIPYLTISD